ncbi:MAG: hypothetical protein ACYCZB_17890 [Acidiphilium sp.]
MYVVPFSVFRHFLGDKGDALQQDETSESITIPQALFNRLLRQALLTHPLDEEAYLADNPDVASSVRRGDFASARDHFVEHGYFECRGITEDEFDEAWYLKANPDVARSIRSGAYPSGVAHFLGAGVYEFRPPNADSESDMNLWRTMLLPASRKNAAVAG